MKSTKCVMAIVMVVLLMMSAGCGGSKSSTTAANDTSSGSTGGNGNDNGGNNNGDDQGGNPVSVIVTISDFSEIAGSTLTQISGDASGLIVSGNAGEQLIMAKLTPEGNVAAGWPKQFSGSNPVALDSNSFMSAMLYKVPSSSVLMMNLYDGTGVGLMTAFNISDNSQAGDLKVDGSAMYICRFGGIESNAIFYSTLATLEPVTVNPTFKPQKLHVLADGIIVAGENMVYKYAKGLTSELWSMQWASTQAARIDSIASDNSRIYIAGADASGDLRLAGIKAPGDAANWARTFVGISAATNKVYLDSDAAGNVYISLGGNMAKIDKTTGNLPLSAAQVPEGPFKIIGNKAYFVQGSKIKSVELSQIP